jgi:carbonic anhydrase
MSTDEGKLAPPAVQRRRQYSDAEVLDYTKAIFTKNAAWAEKKLEADAEFFDRLGASQSPDCLYIGCSDSRVTEAEIMGFTPGQAFVHRNIANMVSNGDLSVMSVINYAVSILKVRHVIICGHYCCGGVKASMESTDLGILNPWVRNIRDVYRLHADELNAIEDEGKRYDRLAEINVQEQCINVLKIPEVQFAFRKTELTMHGWLFDPRTGKLVDLKIDFPKIVKSLREIYHIEEIIKTPTINV